MWLANLASWVSGFFPQASDFTNIINDIRTWGGNVDAAAYGTTNNGFIILNPVGQYPGATYSVTAASYSSGTTTYTIGSHTILVGQIISITGDNPSTFDVSLVAVTAVTSTTVSVAATSNPGTLISGGTLQVQGQNATSGTVVNVNGQLNTYNGSGWTINPGVVAGVDLTAQGANIGSTALYTVPTTMTGFYRMSASIQVTTAATSTSTLPTVSAGFYNADSGVATSLQFVASNAGNTTGTASGGVGVFWAGTTGSISYATGSYATSGATSMKYDLHIKLEYLGS